MLERYKQILQGEARPRFKVTREQGCPLTPGEAAGEPLDELWRVHDAALERSRREQPRRGAGISLLDLKNLTADRMLSSCHFCEHRCLVDRHAGETGVCGVPKTSRYASEFLHHGEEPELVPSHTIFFTGCTFTCVYCQNWDIATRPESGEEVDTALLARKIEQGFQSGSRNVNFVGGNPDSHLHTCIAIVSRLESDIPVVWNSNAYASLETMNLLDGLVDIFLSDFRYGNDDCAREYSGVDRYLEAVTRNLILARGQAEVMIRHLVLPGHLECCTRPVMKWVSANLPGVYFNLMFQYRPVYRATRYPGLDRTLTDAEKRRALVLAASHGIRPKGLE